MDRRERFESPNNAMLAMLQGWQAELWTAMPGIVQSYDHSKKTCTVQVAIQLKFQSPVTGLKELVNIPILPDCPVFFPSGGGYTLTFPVSPGDECLVVVGSRCIDSWWSNGQVGPQLDARMHDLSDSFVFVGISSVPNVQSSISTNSVQLRSNDGSKFIEIAGSNIAIHAPTVNIVGAVNIVGNVNMTGTVKNNGVNIGSAHTHSGVSPGGSNTGGPS